MKFDEECYKILKRVPKGKVVSYKWIGDKIGSKGYRAIGLAMKKNFNPDVPCHRVVKSDGSLGGFNKGVKEKEELLVREGIEVVNGKVDMDKFGFSC